MLCFFSISFFCTIVRSGVRELFSMVSNILLVVISFLLPSIHVTISCINVRVIWHFRIWCTVPKSCKLLQVGAIAPQSLENLLQSIHECIGSSDWATRKAAADALISLALYSSNLITTDGAGSTVTALEACRFDKVDFSPSCLRLHLKISRYQ